MPPTPWRHIRLIGQSGKELDTTKTGRFGLGFNSVYNVTDFPTILTGQRLGIFDPHGKTVLGASVAAPGAAWPLSKLWSKCPDLLAPFCPFGLPHGTSSLSGTVFRLPLRTPPEALVSEISQEPYTPEDFDQIVTKLQSRLSELLLFLKNVQDVELARLDRSGTLHPLLSVRTTNRDHVESARKRIRDLLALEHSRLFDMLRSSEPPPSVSTFAHHVEVAVGEAKPVPERYFIVCGLFLDPNGEVEICAREMMKLKEKAVPLAGAAVRFDPAPDANFSGRVYCGLPLPLESPIRSCHVNGFFDLLPDRQGPFQDQGAGGAAAVRVRWNRLLIEHCCAAAAAQLCLQLSKRAASQGLPLYDHWPRVPERELTLVERLPRSVYAHLKSKRCILAGGDLQWRLPKDVLVPPSGADDDLCLALRADSFTLPSPTLPGFVASGFKAAKFQLIPLTPTYLRTSLRVAADLKVPIGNAPRPCLREPVWVQALLKFCLSDDNIDDLLGVPLAHMADGTLRAFGRDATNFICLGGKEERALFARRTNWYIDADLEAAAPLKGSTPARILPMTPQLVLMNLHNVLPPVGSDSSVELAAAGDAAPSEEWLTKAYEYLAAHSAQIKLENASLQKTPMVPDQFGRLHVMGAAETPLLPASADSQGLIKALTAVGVPLVHAGDKPLKAIRAFVEAYPDQGIWRLSPKDLIDTLAAIAPEDASQPLVDSRSDAAHILDYLASPHAIRELKGSPDCVDKLRTLRLFPSNSGQLVPLDEGKHHVPDQYGLPKINTEIGLLDCGKLDRWLPLYKALHVQKLTRSRLLSQLLLPRLDDLSSEDIGELLRWLRRELQALKEEVSQEQMERLLDQVGHSVPIECSDGQARPAEQLYHPEARFVAPLLGPHVGFPDLDVYRDRTDLWLDLFEALGMARTPRADDIVNAIDAVLVSEGASEEQLERIGDIAEYLNEHWEALKDQPVVADSLRPAATSATEWMLSDALACRAWLPTLQAAPRDYPRQLLRDNPTLFLKPADMLARGALDLAGSVRPICCLSRLFRMQASIGLQADPSLDDVLGQLENLIDLAESGELTIERLTPLFHRIYDHLGQLFPSDAAAFESDPRLAAVRSRFADQPCLGDADGKLWLPTMCFEHSVASFLGRRARIRSEKVNTERGLRVLGRRSPRPASHEAPR